MSYYGDLSAKWHCVFNQVLHPSIIYMYVLFITVLTLLYLVSSTALFILNRYWCLLKLVWSQCLLSLLNLYSAFFFGGNISFLYGSKRLARGLYKYWYWYCWGKPTPWKSKILWLLQTKLRLSNIALQFNRVTVDCEVWICWMYGRVDRWSREDCGLK